MDINQIRRLEPKLVEFLDRFDDCFGRKDTRAPLGVYVRGQLSDRPQTSVEPSAREADVAPRTLPEFLSQLQGRGDQVRDRPQRLVAAAHQGPHPIGLFDETSDPKKRAKTPGVPKQGCGRLGQTDNCLVTVHLGLARGDFHCPLDGELFLPEGGDADGDRGREAGLPDDIAYRPKGKIALELYDRAAGNGTRFDGLTFDEGYGGKPELLRALATRQQRYVAEVPRGLAGWRERPRVVTRPDPQDRRGRGRKVPRRASGRRPARRVDELPDDPRLRDRPWQRFRVKDGAKRPMIWECKHVMLTVKGADGLPGETLHRLVARDVLDPDDLKSFVSDAPPATGVGTLLLVAFWRWRVERGFEDHKTEIGRDQYEGRRDLGWKRHLILSAVSYLSLARVRQEWGGKEPGADGLPTAHGAGRAGPLVGVVVAAVEGEAAGQGGEEDHVGAAAQCSGSKESREADQEKAARTRHQAHRKKALSMGLNLAL